MINVYVPTYRMKSILCMLYFWWKVTKSIISILKTYQTQTYPVTHLTLAPLWWTFLFQDEYNGWVGEYYLYIKRYENGLGRKYIVWQDKRTAQEGCTGKKSIFPKSIFLSFSLTKFLWQLLANLNAWIILQVSFPCLQVSSSLLLFWATIFPFWLSKKCAYTLLHYYVFPYE